MALGSTPDGVPNNTQATSSGVGVTAGANCIGWRSNGAGSFVFQMKNDQANVTATVAAGDYIVGHIRSIDATTDVSGILMYRS